MKHLIAKLLGLQVPAHAQKTRLDTLVAKSLELGARIDKLRDERRLVKSEIDTLIAQRNAQTEG